jgi:hypothetical protein
MLMTHLCHSNWEMWWFPIHSMISMGGGRNLKLYILYNSYTDSFRIHGDLSPGDCNVILIIHPYLISVSGSPNKPSANSFAPVCKFYFALILCLLTWFPLKCNRQFTLLCTIYFNPSSFKYSFLIAYISSSDHSFLLIFSSVFYSTEI